MEENNARLPLRLRWWAKLVGGNLGLFISWQVMVMVNILTPSSDNSNSGLFVSNIILTVGITYSAVIGFVHLTVSVIIVARYHYNIEKVKEDICNQERQVVTLQRQLNQGPRLNFVRLDNEVPLYREIGQTQN